MAQSHLSDISSAVTSLEGAIYFEILVNISSVLSQNSCESKIHLKQACSFRARETNLTVHENTTFI